MYGNFIGETIDGAYDINYASILIIKIFKQFLCKLRC
jgi:hypothetical protein